jgi:hypothetical protein
VSARLLRSAGEFPTPLFRVVCGLAANGLCAGVGVAVFSRWAGAWWPYAVVLAVAALLAVGLPLRFGTTGRSLVGAVLASAALVAGVFAAEVVVSLVTGQWE